MQRPSEVSGLIDLLVEAVLREMALENEDADVSGQEQRRREDGLNESLPNAP